MNTSTYGVGTVVTRKAGGQQYRIIDPPVWLRPDHVRTVSVETGVESSKSIGALDAFYTVIR